MFEWHEYWMLLFYSNVFFVLIFGYLNGTLFENFRTDKEIGIAIFTLFFLPYWLLLFLTVAIYVYKEVLK